MPVVSVKNAANLAHGESLGFDFESAGEQRQGFVMRHREELVAYVNHCPHWGVDLDMGEGKFYAPKVDRIYCRNHGALFEPRSGVCDSGPCAGQSLQKLELRVEGEDAHVEMPG